MRIAKFAALAVAALSVIVLSVPGFAQLPKIGCTFQGKETSLRDRCSFTSSGTLTRFIPKQTTLEWSDGVRTQIEFLTIESLHMGVAEGTATIDGEPATFKMASDGGKCITVIKSGNFVCYR
ncbi:MAG: hypothetical protein J0L70_28760 [Leptolyngbya sp. UWPOB_LEPTO1]|uniref:hypothetical protein n=1 Tax=Leptolyngbya sp. UWPOB_LEPTO1 TaxID=2815653 RepID=UPI001ACB7012|nr:hypothetical protein [Leptolyngbya sp. UWPOB_LEPTO1]MBN8564528.1 hypothetical protein [Leptolyngbya sp. UWPOB_LEPTO1]